MSSYTDFQEDLKFGAAQLDVLAGELDPLLDLVIPFVPLHLRLLPAVAVLSFVSQLMHTLSLRYDSISYTTFTHTHVSVAI